MKTLVIIVTYNAMKWIHACIQSVKGSSVSADIFVVDNKSTDNSVSFLKQTYPDVTVIESDRNLGFGQANNIGLKYAIEHDYDFVYLLNQDAYLQPDTIKILTDISIHNPQIGILSPLQISKDGSLDSNFKKCLPATFFSQTNQNKSACFLTTKFVMAAHWLIPVSVLKKVGGFSPFFFHYDEDNNYADRTRHNGYTIAICPLTKAVHDRSDRPITLQQIAANDYRRVGSIVLNPNLNICKIIACLFIHFGVSLKHMYTYKSFLPITKNISAYKELRKMIQYRKKQKANGAFI